MDRRSFILSAGGAGLAALAGDRANGAHPGPHGRPPAARPRPPAGAIGNDRHRRGDPRLRHRRPVGRLEAGPDGAARLPAVRRAGSLRQRIRQPLRRVRLSDGGALPAAAGDGIGARARDAGRPGHHPARRARGAPVVRRALHPARPGRTAVQGWAVAGRPDAGAGPGRAAALPGPHGAVAPGARGGRPAQLRVSLRAVLRRPGFRRPGRDQLRRLAGPRRLPLAGAALVSRLLLPRRLWRRHRPGLGLGRRALFRGTLGPGSECRRQRPADLAGRAVAHRRRTGGARGGPAPAGNGGVGARA